MGRRIAPRLKLLRALWDSRHRYDARRALGMALTLGVLFAVPLSGLARLDLWQGEHRLLFRAVGFKACLGGVILAIGAFYVATFLVNVAGGRLFCGWGCPVGQLSRFGEAVDTPGGGLRAHLERRLEGALFSVLFSFSIFIWWVDPLVLVQGAANARLLAWSILLATVLAAYAHGRWWRWGFCMTTCPIGLYYSFVSPAHWFGVHFRNAEDTCVECDACDIVCPVLLAPRDLMAAAGERPGLSVADAPGRNHCLECGDCVRACEWIIERRGQEPVPLLMGFFSGAQRVDHEPDLAREPEQSARSA